MTLSRKIKSNVIWGVWSIFIASNLFDLFFVNPQITTYSSLHFFKLGMAVVLSLLHALWFLGLRRGALFFSLSVLAGALAEYLSLDHGTVFGGTYTYQGGYFGPELSGLPVFIPLFWFVYIYTAYLIASSLFLFRKMETPSFQNGQWYFLPALIVLDGLIVLAIDIILDPVMVKAGWWTWTNGGPFYEVPVGNFIGWFLVAAVTTTIFRFLEFFYPQRNRGLENHTLLPGYFSYAALLITLSMYAIQLGMPELPLVGTLAMLPVVLIGFSLYFSPDQDKNYTLPV
jgi:putative membrane protein